MNFSTRLKVCILETAKESTSVYFYLYSTIIFDLVTLTLTFDLLLKKFNLGHNFQTRRDRAFLLHMCIPCEKTFHMVP